MEIPWDLVLTIGSFFLFGVSLGKIIEDIRSRAIFEKELDRIIKQKNKLMKLIRGI